MRHILGATALAAGLLLAVAQGATAAGLEPGQLTDDQLRITLQARGYSDLAGFERIGGDTVRLPAARRYGEPVGPLALDARTGQVRDEPPLTEGQLRAMLQARGFSEVEAVRREGEVLLARAQRGGNRVEMRVDPRTGTVTGQEMLR